MQTPKFKVEFLKEAAEFLDSLNEKVRDKIIYKHHEGKVFYRQRTLQKVE